MILYHLVIKEANASADLMNILNLFKRNITEKKTY